MEWIIPGLLALIALMGTLASCGWDVIEMRNREVWWWTGILLLLILLMPNHWMAAVLAAFTIGLFQIGRAWFILRSLIIPTAGLAGIYSVMAGVIAPWMVMPVLWAIAVIGAALGVWTLFSKWHGIPYTYILPEQPFAWFGKWGVYEHLPLPANYMSGQGNTMHLLSVVSICLAAGAGLVWMGQWGAVPLLLLTSATIVLCQVNKVADSVPNRHWHPNQGVLHVLVLVGAIGVLLWPMAVIGAAVMVALVTLLITQPWKVNHWGWWDSGRIIYWKEVLQLIWWPQGWRCRLFGFGTGTWFLASGGLMAMRKHQNVMTAAHNEYVQQLVEHGILGLMVLCGYLADALWRTAHGGVEGQAVFLVGIVACSVAAVNFPWAYYHEYHPKNMTEEMWYGSPSLNALSFVIAVLAEAF